ncbi:ABC transporter permease [Paludibacterium purpuratum]|uniref:Putative spermidine/putrescine transport system permease protein n=1 Tax=Paludibacterium purpuratum TaxID=1144873 RepID=A0A4R7B656_9NEIS|nr:ABC transporter permease [Paludibacterium purpuratum]TDR79923.1 putative spermidine/putrescine transport system permease protein [Paludibacterium purpuratum]
MPHDTARRGLSRLTDRVYLSPTLWLCLLLAPPLLWFGLVYIGSLLTLLVQSFFSFDDFTMNVSTVLTLDNYRALLSPANLDVILRTLSMAAAVTLASAILAFPLAYYMARYARGWKKGFFYVAVMLPMWASYIVKAYSWTVILAKGGLVYWFYRSFGLSGVVDWLLSLPGIGGGTLATSNLGRFTVFTYIWLPFMILPIQAALERVPGSLVQAAADLGATPWQAFRTIILPLAFPGVVAGSIFTFSLTLGDYIIPQLFGPSGLFIGTMVYTMQGAIGNLPMAGAFTLVPVLIIALYLSIAKRLGAFDAL